VDLLKNSTNRLVEVGDFVKRDEEIATIETDKVGVCYEWAFLKVLWLMFFFRSTSPSTPQSPAQSLSYLLRRRTLSPSARTSSSWISGELQRRAAGARKQPEKSRRHRGMLLPKSPKANKPLLRNSVRKVGRYQRQSKNLLLHPPLLPPNLPSKLNSRGPRQSHPNLSPLAKEGSATAKRSV